MPLYISVAVLVCLFGLTSMADVRLPSFFSDNMVLQKDTKVPVWGWADPGEKVSVRLEDNEVAAVADGEGRWRVELDLSGSKPGPFQMIVQGKNRHLIDNVLVGEVWLCSGQSNMEWVVEHSKDAEQEIRSADWPQIRHFEVGKRPSPVPEEEAAGRWVVCSPETVARFTAVGYFFGRELHKELKTPIGLVNATWGGTPAEAWTSREALATMGDFGKVLERQRQAAENLDEARAQYAKDLAAWEEKTLHQDPGNEGIGKGWAKPDFDDSAWAEMNLPTHWERQGLAIDGAVWFRRTVELDAQWQGKELTLELGPIDDFDITYFNGEQIGATGKETPDAYRVPRVYRIPAELVKEGPNVLAIRVFDRFGNGGICGTPSEMTLSKGEDSIPLAGPWKYEIELRLKPLDVSVLHTQPQSPAVDLPTSPATLFNGLIHPVIPYAIRGVIWYQGENNAGAYDQYKRLFPLLIEDWRQRWDRGDFPFLFVQLASFMFPDEEPKDDIWPRLRETQLQTWQKVPNTAMAVAIDIGDMMDIHPANKQDVGKRLSLAALATVYGRKIEYSGPVFKEMEVEGDKVRLRFDHTDGGLEARGDKLGGFAICGPDRKFVWADAELNGNSVLVWSDKVKEPVAVRYGWANFPLCNLYNKAGLPAVPFRTDDFPRE